MSKPQKSYPNLKLSRPKWLVYAIRSMLAVALLACVFVIVQSCSLERTPDLQRFAKGGLKKLQILETPLRQPNTVFKDKDGNDVRLSDFRGRVILLNVWATWCVPCVAEIPSLDRLQAERGSADFSVIAISMDRHMDDAKAFYKKSGINNLALYRDPTYSISSKVGVQAIPISVFYGPNGQEIARVAGEVDWQAAETSALLDAILLEH